MRGKHRKVPKTYKKRGKKKRWSRKEPTEREWPEVTLFLSSARLASSQVTNWRGKSRNPLPEFFHSNLPYSECCKNTWYSRNCRCPLWLHREEAKKKNQPTNKELSGAVVTHKKKVRKKNKQATKKRVKTRSQKGQCGYFYFRTKCKVSSKAHFSTNVWTCNFKKLFSEFAPQTFGAISHPWFCVSLIRQKASQLARILLSEQGDDKCKCKIKNSRAKLCIFGHQDKTFIYIV